MLDEELRRRRLAQLSQMSDEEVTAELVHHQAARWRPAKLLEHVKKRRPDFEEYLGRVLTPTEVDGLSRRVLQDWERAFTELAEDGGVTYYFATMIAGVDRAIIVATRGGRIRTLIVAGAMSRWLERAKAVVEVTERVRRAGP